MPRTAWRSMRLRLAGKSSTSASSGRGGGRLALSSNPNSGQVSKGAIMRYFIISVSVMAIAAGVFCSETAFAENRAGRPSAGVQANGNGQKKAGPVHRNTAKGGQHKHVRPTGGRPFNGQGQSSQRTGGSRGMGTGHGMGRR